MLLLISNVSAFNFVFKNPNKQSFTMNEIVSELEVYKTQLKLDKCIDKNNDFLEKAKKKVHPCIDKYYYLFNSYFWLYQLENV